MHIVIITYDDELKLHDNPGDEDLWCQTFKQSKIGKTTRVLPM